MIDKLITLSIKRDIDVWKVSSEFIVKNIKSKEYILIVPSRDVNFFNKINKNFKIFDEAVFLDEISKNIPNWYKQQIIKINSLSLLSKGEIALIWDSDTIPIKKLNFLDKKGRLIYFSSTEFHKPYFEFIQDFLNMTKLESNSFISQCFPIKYEWYQSFKTHIQKTYNLNLSNAIISHIDFSKKGSFSEYETLGTYISYKYKGQYVFNNLSWIRRGYMFFRTPINIKYFSLVFKFLPYHFIAFENWDSKISITMIINKIKRYINKLFVKSKPDIKQYMKLIFENYSKIKVIQVGANDGVQNDPLRYFIKRGYLFNAILIEPIPFYFEKLKKLYKDNNNISLINAAISKTNTTRKIYFIPPSIADEMNGDGPNNDWAHGQGSFDKNIIIYWIKKNSFRGQNYRDNINKYIDSITYLELQPLQLSTFQIFPEDLFLIIDVQGFELDVLKTVNWEIPPKFILVEDDLKNNDLVTFLEKKNYKWVAGKADKIFKYISNHE